MSPAVVKTGEGKDFVSLSHAKLSKHFYIYISELSHCCVLNHLKIIAESVKTTCAAPDESENHSKISRYKMAVRFLYVGMHVFC